MYTTIIIIFSIVVLVQLWYIIRLRNAIRYAVQTLIKFEAALTADSMLMEQMKKGTNDGSKET